MRIIFIITICSIISTGMGVIISNRFTMQKIEKMEKMVEEHNSLMDKMKSIERKANLANIRIDRIRIREKNKKVVRIQKKRQKRLANT